MLSSVDLIRFRLVAPFSHLIDVKFLEARFCRCRRPDKPTVILFEILINVVFILEKHF